MILYFHGPDTFSSRRDLTHQITRFKKERDPQGYNTIILDGKTTALGKIVSEIFSAPFLAEKRLIVVENLLSNSDKELLGEIMALVKDKKIPENNVVIFWQGDALSKVKEAKELEAVLMKEKYVRDFPALSGGKISEWITAEVAAGGGAIAPDAIGYLSINIGGDMWLLHSVVSQLLAYTAGGVPPLPRGGDGGVAVRRPITIADVGLFLSEKIDDNVFNMVDAIVGGNHKLAFRLLTEQRRLGEEDGKLFGLILWQVKILLQIADFLEKEGNATSDVVAKKIGVHPFVAKKNFALARRYSLAKLENLYSRLLDIDIKTKTGQANQGLLIDLFVAGV